MCTYCGCRNLTLIRRLSDEHDAIVNALGVLRRAASNSDAEESRLAAQQLADLLDPHTSGEEHSLFAELSSDPEFAEHVAALCDEHREITEQLSAVIQGDVAGVPSLETLLRAHIDREENGLFPAAAIALDGPAWERLAAPAP